METDGPATGDARQDTAHGRWLWRADAGRVRLRNQRSPTGWIVAGAASLLVLDGLASLLLPSAASVAPAAARQAVRPAGPAAWQDIPGPLHLFTLSGSPFARLPLSYAARRDADGTERQDTLTFGAFGEAVPLLHLAILRRGADPRPQPDLVVDLARLAATEGLAVTRVGLPLNLMTRFGLFDTADVTLQRADVAVPCLGFRLESGTGPVAMAGVVCGGGDALVDRASLGCVLDRIDLVSAGDDRVLRDMFVAAERRRGESCARRRSLAVRDEAP